MNSGVGPTATLVAAGVPVLYNSPCVGNFLRNHQRLIIIFTANKEDFDKNCLYSGGAYISDNKNKIEILNCRHLHLHLILILILK